ncbi:MAG: hypothetical protein WKH97_13085 [Casimicrobiaceae bacterium]
MNGLTLLVLIAAAAGLIVAFRAGVARGRNVIRYEPPRPQRASAPRTPADPASPARTPSPANGMPAGEGIASEPPGVIASLRAEKAALRSNASTMAAEHVQLAAFAEDRRTLHRELALARGETARFRTLVVDLENNTPPPLLTGPNTPDDLKLIVGIGPVLERMLFQLGISTYGQIARMNDRDIDALDGRLPEFPGRIRRDEWVKQARALHQYKYGASERGGQGRQADASLGGRE